ncbi:uncharacterized protein H6S33_008862 [Morchella sextelata]|uniref:uncharacterized protein n=1 Tax=Morchella sextelata TaxID=1174677 RepID=UPI001D05105B|nr:uncharacterized protein H6S33_008862 [Morchella sextelata]KAH0612482.1 hypothetical protein H6S33_008862 [Morchella sextelata]
MGKGKRNHKNKKSKPSKPAAASGAGHSQEPVTTPPQIPLPHSDFPIPSTEDKPPAGSIGIGAPIENKLLETHPLPVEKGIPKAEESGESVEKMSTGIENEPTHDSIMEEEERTVNVPTSEEAEPAPRTTGSGDNSEIEQDKQKEEKEVSERTEVTEKKEEEEEAESEEEESESEEDRKPSTETPNPTSSETASPAHKKRPSRSGTSVETQELKHNHLHPEDIGPQHTKVDRETRELRHIDLEGGEIGYNVGKGDDHDRGSEHHAPAEPIMQDSTNEAQCGIEEPSNETLAEEIVRHAHVPVEDPLTKNPAQNADKESAEASSCGEEMTAAIPNVLENQSTHGIEGKTVIYAQVSASDPPNGESAQEWKGSKEVQSSLKDSLAEVAAEEIAPETQESKDIDINGRIGHNLGEGENNGQESEDHDLTASVAGEVSAGGSSLGKLIDEPRGIDEEPVSAIGEEIAKQVQSSVEVTSSETVAEEVTPETEELKDIDVKDEIGYNLGKGDSHDHWTQHHAPTEGPSTEAAVLETSSGAERVGIPTHGQQTSQDSQNITEETSPGVSVEKVSSETEELKVINVDDEIGYNPGKGDDHDRGSEHHAPMEEVLVENLADKAKIDVENPSTEASLGETVLGTQELKDIDMNHGSGYNPGEGDTHARASDHAPAEEVSIKTAADKETQETEGSLTHDQVAEELEEAFEELLMEDSAHEREIPEDLESSEDMPAGEAAGEELAFCIAAGVRDLDGANEDEFAGEQKIYSAAAQDEASIEQSDSSNLLKDTPVKEIKESGLDHGLPHIEITNDDVSNNAYTENASDTIKQQNEERARDASLPKWTEFGMDTPERQEIGRKDSSENLASQTSLGIDSLASELGKDYHVPMSNDPSSRGDTSDTPLTYQEDFFSERLSDLTGDREILEYECSIKIGDSRPEPSLIGGTTVTLDQLQETISCFKREILESLESHNLLVDTGDAQRDQEQQKLTIDISQLGPRLGKMESDLDFIRKQISSINTSNSNGPSLLPQYSSKSDRASRSTSPSPPVPERGISWSMISLSVVTALGLVALGSMLGSVAKERGLTDKVAQWLFSEGKAMGK